MTRLHTQRPLARTPVALAVAFAIGAASLARGQEAEGVGGRIEEVTITGSRIAVEKGMETPTPVTAVTSADLEKMSAGNVIDALGQLPSFFGNLTADRVIGGQNSGGTNVNLRGAGVNRTLVLLEGRRVVSSNRFGTVDVDMVPKALLKGVDIVTGGASASYGTDAVAGVVNFLVDTDFQGLKTHAQAGETTRWDGRNWEGSLAFGHVFGEKLHVVGSFGMEQQEPIDSFRSLRERSYFNQTARITNPDPNGPREIIRPYVTASNFSNNGVMVENSTAAGFPASLRALDGMQFQPDGSIAPSAYTGVGSRLGGCFCYATPNQTYGVDADDEVQSGYRLMNSFVHVAYDINEDAQVYLQGLHGMTRTNDRRESVSLLSVWQGRIYADNAYLAPSARQAILDAAAGATGAFARPDPYVGFGLFALDRPDTPLGESRHFTQNFTDQATLGFKSQLGGSWKLDAFYQYGENQQDFIIKGGIRVDRLPMALDAVRDANGNIVCRVSLPQFDPNGIFKGCAPINLFGGLQNVSPQAVAWIRDDEKIARQYVDLQVAEAVVTGDVWRGFGAGPIAAAFGASYRKESLRQRTMDPSDEFPALPDGTLLSSLGIAPASLRGVVPQGQSGGVAGYTGIPGLRFVPTGFLGDANSSSVLFSSLRTFGGSYNVKEGFTEFNVPLLRNASWAQLLDVNVAGRWASYSGSGSIWAWKAGVNWGLNDQLRFRATQSRDVRAATLQERFDQTRGGVNVQDPLNGNTTVTTASFSGGNPNVQPESADTTTIGVVYRPSWLEGFSTSVDWYRIDISDAIGQLTAQNEVTACATGADPSLCQSVSRRDGAPNGVIERVETLFINIAQQTISGIDLETSYRHDVRLFGGGPEQITWRFFGTFLNDNSIQNRGGLPDQRVGQLGPGLPGGIALPKYKFTTNVSYRNGPFTVFMQGRYLGGGILDRLRTESTGNALNTIDDNTVPSTFYADLNLSYVMGAQDALETYLNVTNLFDRAPVLTPDVVGRAGTTPFNTSIYDVVGRRFVLGFNYRF
ncbi:MAG TPA: TonB-dependent receptor [Steroidobacteraceae bacterium]|nr:TonB-dependent receptor [Steroidobacteraceae bacterium]